MTAQSGRRPSPWDQSIGDANDVADHQARKSTLTGDPGAFMELVGRHAGRCLRVARQVLRDEALAQDAVREAYLDLWRHAGRFDAARSITGPWLVNLTLRRAVHRVRLERARARPPGAVPDLPSEYNLKDETHLRLLGGQTAALLRELPEAQRRCLMLAYWGGYTMVEIGTLLDLPVGTVKTRCRTAVQRLQSLMHERGLDPPGRSQVCQAAVEMTVKGSGHVPQSPPERHPPQARDLDATQRDQAAELRDDAAGDRHMQADLRDVAAARRDELTQEHLVTSNTAKQLVVLYVSSQRKAAADRLHASADRHAAGRDRIDAAKDRQASAADRRQASLDPLTGAYTRAAGFTELRRDVDRARRESDPLTLAFVDVDGLKTICDTHGHAAGDRALSLVVQALRVHLRAHDLVIRFGGDEFLCSVSGMDQTDLTERLAHVSRALQDSDEPVGISVGLATLGPEETVDELFARADADFYATRKRR